MRSRFGLRVTLAVALAGLLVACALRQVEEPDIAQIPDGPLEVVGGGFDPIGEIVVLGSGRTNGVGWRYSAFESTDGWCTQLETMRFTTSGCGDIEPGGGSVIGSIGSGESGAGFTLVDGVVAAEASDVWIEATDGSRRQAELVSLEPAGLSGHVFLAVLPEELQPLRVLAMQQDGTVLEARELR